MPRNLWNQKVNFQVHKTSRPDQSHPLSLTPVLMLIPPFMSRISNRHLCFKLFNIESPQAFLFAPMPTTYPDLLTALYSIKPVHINKSSILCSSSQAPPTFYHEKRMQNFSLITLLSATLSLFPSLSVRKVVSHHYRTNTQNSDLHVFRKQTGSQQNYEQNGDKHSRTLIRSSSPHPIHWSEKLMICSFRLNLTFWRRIIFFKF